MNDSPKISVVIPAYNTANWIQPCLDSILNQSYGHLEVIVIDDGSTDATFDIVKEYSLADSRIRVFQQVNKGVAAARAMGLSQATGEYVGFVDSDDVLHTSMYEQLMHIALTTRADIVCCEMSSFDKTVDTCCENIHINVYTISSGEALQHLLFTGVVDSTMCAKLYKRNLISPKSFCEGVTNNEDLFSNFVIIQEATIIAISNFVGYYYRNRQGSASRGGVPENSVIHMKLLVRERIFKAATRKNLRLASISYASTIFSFLHKFVYAGSIESAEIANTCIRSMKCNGEIFVYASIKQKIMRFLCLNAPQLYIFILRCYRKWMH